MRETKNNGWTAAGASRLDLFSGEVLEIFPPQGVIGRGAVEGGGGKLVIRGTEQTPEDDN